MKVFKFGGASIKNADAVRNLVDIVKDNIGYELVIVASAMGKMTNALERLCREFYYKDGDINVLIEPIKAFHQEICDELFDSHHHKVYHDIEVVFERMKDHSIELKRNQATYDFIYDQIVSEGEVLSTTIINHFLNDEGIYSVLLNAKHLISTNNRYRDAVIEWDKTESNLKEHITFSDNTVYLIQGFIGGCEDGHSTTLGREGSDFTAAIVANCMEAKEVVIWKDVQGLLNADPKYFSNTKKLNNISYHEAVELAYYGATVIHPKTIKPLQNKGIPLYVKSFKEKSQPGSLINEDTSEDSLIPSYIFKSNQVLYSIITRDYSFITEEVLSELFSVFSRLNLKINLMETSAIGFAACFDYDEEKIKELTKLLSSSYKVLYNKDVELMTIRHYNQVILDQLVVNKEILVEQKSRHTARIVMKPKD